MYYCILTVDYNCANRGLVSGEWWGVKLPSEGVINGMGDRPGAFDKSKPAVIQTLSYNTCDRFKDCRTL